MTSLRDVDVRPCDSPSRFLRAAARFYQDDPHWVPPMLATDTAKVDVRRNPFFEHAEGALWLAWRGAEIVGRISACRDRLHDDFHEDRVGFFGHFEAADEAAAHALLATAKQWLGTRGASTLRGPIDFSTNYRCGLLIEGASGPPFVMMPHNPPEYADWLVSFGLTKAKDLIALLMLAENLDLSRMDRMMDRIRARTPVRTRRLDPKRFAAEIDLIWRLYNKIWERNWGFVPMSRAEFLAEAKELKLVLRTELTVIVERESDGEPIAFAIGIPDINRAAKACGGRLFPFGWWHFLREMRRANTFRTITLGVVPEVRATGIDALLLRTLIAQGLDAGFFTCEASWILEDNLGMLRPLQAIGGKIHRRYRIFETTI